MRLLKAALSVLALALVPVLGAPAYAQGPSSPELDGLTYTDVPAEQLDGPTEGASLTIEALAVDGADISLRGTVQYGDSAYPLDLAGTFYASRLGRAGDRVARADDRTGNFQVLHLAVRRAPSSEALVVREQIRGPAFFLYLQRTGTREATFIEAPITDPELRNRLVSLLRAKHEGGTFGTDSWQARLFEPFRVATGDDTIGIQVQDIDRRTYDEFYWVTDDCWVDYNIRFQAYANAPEDIYRSSADFYHKLEILEKWTDSNCAFYMSDDSPLQIAADGDYVDVKTRTYGDGSSTGDVLLKGRYNGAFETVSWSPGKVAVSLGPGHETASVNWSYTLCCENKVKKNEGYVFSQADPDKWTILAEYAYTDRYLPDEGDHFQAIVQNAYGTGGRGSKELDVRWRVPIYLNQDGYTWHGQTYYLYTTLTYKSG